MTDPSVFEAAISSITGHVGVFGPTSFKAYANKHGFPNANTAHSISIDFIEKLDPLLYSNDTMVFRLGVSEGQRTTNFALVKCKGRLKDFFLFDSEIYDNLPIIEFNIPKDKRKYLPYIILPDLTEISFVHLGLFSGLFANALNLDKKRDIIIPASTHSTFTFSFKPHSALPDIFHHNKGQVEIDAVFLEKRGGVQTLFLIEAKNGFGNTSPKTLSKHKLLYPLLSIADKVPAEIPIVPIYVKVQKGNNGLVFNIAEMKCGDPRDGLISIDELLLERASRYFFPLSFL
ncbi:MAG: hypothetical protein GX268_05435 [Methanomicrobiales archaeon]|jgi:hypothetical protein|nr:hypothetical protein [Methanomicrobiales archaeon]